MSTEATTRYVLVCDGCGAKHGAPTAHRSGLEARAAAYGDGWRFPNQIRKNGTPSSNTSDACPGCITDWVPQERASRSRYVNQSEVGY